MSSASGPASDGGSFAEAFRLTDGSTAIGVWDASGHGQGATERTRLVRTIQFTVDGRHLHLPPTGPALGIFEDAEFREDIVRFAFGDILVVVTAGITDARPLNSQTEFFGSRNLCALFQRSQAKGAITASSLISRTRAYSDGRLDNDAAALVARFA